MIRRILALCSRDEGNDEVYQTLSRYATLFESRNLSWDELIHEAEFQGIAPLVFKHLSASGYELPAQARRPLHSLTLRHTHANTIRNEITAEFLLALNRTGLGCLLVKGIYLCNTVYGAVGDRPMRDIDVLVEETEAEKVRNLLIDLGFEDYDHPEVDAEHHHLNPLVKSVDGLQVSVEVHRQLLPAQLQAPRWSYSALIKRAEQFKVGGVDAFTLNLEDTLHYLYLHGFKLPLTYEPFRLIHVADLVSLVELYHREINWPRLQADLPEVYVILSRLHFLTPYQPEVVNSLPLDLENIPDRPGSAYSGWPLRSKKDIPASELISFVSETLWPPQWWMQMHYGKIGGLPYLKARFFEHPRTIWRWAKTFWTAQ